MSEEEEEQLLRANTTMPMFDKEDFNNWKPEWVGMPEYVQPNKMAFRDIVIHFKDQDAVDEFRDLVQQKITSKTKYLWFPNPEIEYQAHRRYACES